MQDESRNSGQVFSAQPTSRRRMDFAPLHHARYTTSALPTDRELERRKIAKQELARREAIRQQIEEQNRLKNLNQRRIEAAKLELSEYQALEEARNHALEAERQKAIKRQRLAQREAAEQMATRRKAVEMEARKRALEAKKRKELAMQEMQRHEEASKISVSRRISLKPRQTSPFFSPEKKQAQLSSSNQTSSLRPAGDTKVLPSSRIQVVASPSRKLFGRIRPAGPARQPAVTETTASSTSTSSSNRRLSSTLSEGNPEKTHQVIQPETDDLEELLLSAFDETDALIETAPFEESSDYSNKTTKSANLTPKPSSLASSKSYLSTNSSKTDNFSRNSLVTPNSADLSERNVSQSSFRSSKNQVTNENFRENNSKTSDTSENNMNYVLGGRSPFINTDKIVKRPLSDSRKEDNFNKTSLSNDNQKDSSNGRNSKSRKNIYTKRETAKKTVKKSTMIVEDRPKGVGISLAIAITFMIILGTIVGALVYFAFFQ